MDLLISKYENFALLEIILSIFSAQDSPFCSYLKHTTVNSWDTQIFR